MCGLTFFPFRVVNASAYGPADCVTYKPRDDHMWRRFCHLGSLPAAYIRNLLALSSSPWSIGSICSSAKSPIHAPSASASSGKRIADSSLLLLVDILPTRYFAALQALNRQNMRPCLEGEVSLNGEPSGAAQGLVETLRIAILGLGPVALVCWFTQTPKMMSRTALL